MKILREINFRESKSSENVVIGILGALNFAILINFSPQGCKNSYNSKLRASQLVKMAGRF